MQCIGFGKIINLYLLILPHKEIGIKLIMKKYLILLSCLVTCIGVSAQEKEVEVGMKCIVETAIIDSVDCSNEYFIKDIYVDYCVYTDDITLGTVVKFRHYESIGRLSR